MLNYYGKDVFFTAVIIIIEHLKKRINFTIVEFKLL